MEAYNEVKALSEFEKLMKFSKENKRIIKSINEDD
jgi:hypothetical protein